MGIIRLNRRVKPADDAISGTEHQAESNQPEHRRADAEVHQVFHQDVAGIFGTSEARFTHRKARLHEEDHRGAQQHPYGVYRRIQHTQFPPDYPPKRTLNVYGV